MARFKINECWSKEGKDCYKPLVKKYFLFIPYWTEICNSVYPEIKGAEDRIEIYKKFGTKDTIKELD